MARLRQQQATEELQPFIQSDVGVPFIGGVAHVNDRPQVPTDVQHWLSSNGLTQYTTITWIDPTTGERRTSCNCPGWTIKKKGSPKRTCCHTQDMEGTRPCFDKEKVENEPIPIRTVRDVQKHIPTVEGTRELRAIMLD
jgi:hypothetical protein